NQRLALPPSGNYYPVLFLVEYTPACPETRRHYCIDDYVNLIDLTTAAPTVTVSSSGVDTHFWAIESVEHHRGNAAFSGPAFLTCGWWNCSGDITVAGVVNTTTTATSGSLQFELWLLTQPYSSGSSNSGYKVTSFRLPAQCAIGGAQLAPAASCASIDSGV